MSVQNENLWTGMKKPNYIFACDVFCFCLAAGMLPAGGGQLDPWIRQKWEQTNNGRVFGVARLTRSVSLNLKLSGLRQRQTPGTRWSSPSSRRPSTKVRRPPGCTAVPRCQAASGVCRRLCNWSAMISLLSRYRTRTGFVDSCRNAKFCTQAQTCYWDNANPVFCGWAKYQLLHQTKT